MQSLPYYQMLSQINQLDDLRQFKNNFKTPNLLQLFYKIDRASQQQSLPLIAKIKQNIIDCQRKSVYIALKWLIFIHQAFRTVRVESLLQKMIDILYQMPSPKAQSKHDEYLNQRLVEPYKQYLKKLSCILLIKLQGPSPQRTDISMEQRIYCFYNLINFASGQFTKPIKQFTNFLENNYPCLTHYIDLISNDLKGLYKKIRHSFLKRSIETINFIEVDRLGQFVNFFQSQSKNPSAINYLFDSTNAVSGELSSNSNKQSLKNNSPKDQKLKCSALTSAFSPNCPNS